MNVFDLEWTRANDRDACAIDGEFGFVFVGVCERASKLAWV